MLLFKYVKDLISYQEGLCLQTDALTHVFDDHDLVYILAMRVNPVFSLGRRTDNSQLINNYPNNIEKVRTDRGGLITYHGPEQILIYPLVHLGHFGLSTTQWVHFLEQSMIDYLYTCNIHAQRLDKRPGVYVGLAKIGFIGLHIQQGISTHGLALNVCGPIQAFSWIDPCGFKGQETTSLSELINQPPAYELIAQDIAHRIYAFISKHEICFKTVP